MSRTHLFLMAFFCTTACGSAGTGRTRATALKGNTVYLGDDGTVVVKGFGDLFSASTVCVLPPGATRVLADQTTKVAAEGGYSGATGKAEVENATKRRLDKVFEVGSEMVYVQQIYANACVMFGNGLFGPTCETGETRRGKQYCKSGAPDTTMNAYQAFIISALQVLTVARQAPTPVADGTEGNTPDSPVSPEVTLPVTPSSAAPSPVTPSPTSPTRR